MRKLIVLLAAASLLVAGCGGGGSSSGTTTTKASSSKPLTKPQYQAKIREIGKQVGTQLGKSNQDASKLTKKDVDKLTTALRLFADKLDALTPPVAVAALHKELVADFRQLAVDFPGIADKLKNAKDPSTAIVALFGAASIQKLAKLQQQFKAKGYDLNLNG